MRSARFMLTVGTRPEIVKMAPILRAAAEHGLAVDLVHTGQHYDDALDGVFFRELGLQTPVTRLDVGSADRASQLARVEERLGPWIDRLRPDAVVVQGDTNSVLGAARAAVARGTWLAHVEAGLRCGDLEMPEELNRRETDRLSDWLFAPTPEARDHLLREGCDADRVFVTGNTVVDELELQLPRARGLRVAAGLGLRAGAFGLATIHRRENVEDPLRLRDLLQGLEGAAGALGLPVVLPLHPRTAARIQELGLVLSRSCVAIPPKGYLEFLSLLSEAALVWTDSGGVQEEACSLGVPCVVLRESTERPEAIAAGAGRLAGRYPAAIVEASRELICASRSWNNPFGDGKAGERIVSLLIQLTAHASRRNAKDPT